MKDAIHHKERTLEELSVTVWLTPENAHFSFQDHFLYIETGEIKTRAFLVREFPFELEWEFISVLNDSNEEIGIVRDIALFGEDASILKEELKRRYYAPVIKRILSVKERYGFSYWKVECADGEVSFTLHDTYRNLIHAGEDRVIMLDVNGNRFEIPSVAALDKKSFKKIELYL